MIVHPFAPDTTELPDRIPDPGAIDLWWIDLRVTPDQQEVARRLLDPDELKRAERFRFDRHRRRFIVRRAQLRRVLGAYLGINPRDVSFELGEREKPFLAGRHSVPGPEPLEFNLSDSEDVAVVGVKIGIELGVDVEVVRPMPDALSICRHFFASIEQEELAKVPAEQVDATFFRCWTRKEAYIKAVGKGLALPLDSFTVTMIEGEPSRFRSFDGLPDEPREWSLTHLEPEPGVFVAVAVREREPTLFCRRLPPPQ